MSGPMAQLIAAHLAAHPVTTQAALADAGVTRGGIDQALRRGQLLRCGNGVFATPEAETRPNFDNLCACLATGGILCAGTAAFHHGLTDEIPGQIDVLMPYGSGRSVAGRRTPVRYARSRLDQSFTVGIEEVPALGQVMRITDKARTVVDLVRGPVRQHAVAAVHRYLMDGGSGDELARMAEAFGAERKVAPLLEGTLQAMSRTL